MRSERKFPRWTSGDWFAASWILTVGLAFFAAACYLGWLAIDGWRGSRAVSIVWGAGTLYDPGLS